MVLINDEWQFCKETISIAQTHRNNSGTKQINTILHQEKKKGKHKYNMTATKYKTQAVLWPKTILVAFDNKVLIHHISTSLVSIEKKNNLAKNHFEVLSFINHDLVKCCFQKRFPINFNWHLISYMYSHYRIYLFHSILHFVRCLPTFTGNFYIITENCFLWTTHRKVYVCVCIYQWRTVLVNLGYHFITSLLQQ